MLFLNQTLYRNFFIIINYWSFVHIASGVIFYFLKSKKYDISTWFSIYLIAHIIFEVIEYILALGGNPLFVEESIDIIWDIMFGLIGFGLMYFMEKR